MILQGTKRGVFRDVVHYYMSHFDASAFFYVAEKRVTQSTGEVESSYSNWLALQCLRLLESRGISAQDCIDNRDIVKAGAQTVSGIKQVWVREALKYVEKAMVANWQDCLVLEIMCSEKDGSVALKNDWFIHKHHYLMMPPGGKAEFFEDKDIGFCSFQCDVTSGIDYDEYNQWFTDKLPESLRDGLRSDAPLFIMLDMSGVQTKDRGTELCGAMETAGIGKDSAYLLHQYIYRVLLLVRTHRLHNVWLGVFGNIDYMVDDSGLFGEFGSDFQYVSGMAFTPTDFAPVLGASSPQDEVLFTVWSTQPQSNKQYVLDVKASGMDGQIYALSKRPIFESSETIHEWVTPADVSQYTSLPVVTSAMFANTDKMAKVATNALCQMMTAPAFSTSVSRCVVTNMACSNGVDVTEENLWRCVASFAVRRCVTDRREISLGKKQFLQPTVTLEGYANWLADALVLFLFDTASCVASYRNVILGTDTWSVGNKMFPIAKEVVQSLGVSEEIQQDMLEHPGDNAYIVGVLKECVPKLSIEGLELYKFCLTFVLNSLQGEARKGVGYKHSSVAWDASFAQLRSIPELWDSVQERQYIRVVTNLRNKMYNGIYTFGFMPTVVDTMVENGE